MLKYLHKSLIIEFLYSVIVVVPYFKINNSNIAFVSHFALLPGIGMVIRYFVKPIVFRKFLFVACNVSLIFFHLKYILIFIVIHVCSRSIGSSCSVYSITYFSLFIVVTAWSSATLKFVNISLPSF